MRRAGIVLAVIALMAVSTAAHAAVSPPAVRQTPVSELLASKLATATPSEQLVVFVHAADLATSRKAVAQAGLAEMTTWHSIGVTVASGTPAQVRAVRTNPGVTYVELDQPAKLYLDTANVATRANEARSLPQLDDVNGNPLDGSGVTIAINDSGVDGSHEMFTANGVSKVKVNIRELCHQAVCSGFSADMAQTAFNDSDTVGLGGHGTHVAGIAAGYERLTDGGRLVRGAAPGATLFAFGSGAALSILAGNTGLQYVLDKHANPCAGCPPIRVVNNSWGSGSGSFNPNSATAKLENKLVDAGVVVVFAAGNGDALGNGGDGSTNMMNPESQNPKPGVIAVANYDDADSGTRDGSLDPSSSRGKNGETQTYPDLAAPGASITSACRAYQALCPTFGLQDGLNYSALSGTSMAAPYVAGVIALMLQADPTLTPAQVENLLEDTAYKFSAGAAYEADPTNPDDTTSFDKGHGLVDVTALLGAVLNETVPGGPTPPPPPTTETKAYTGAYGDAAVNCALGLGGVCFDINNVKPGATITINDDNAEWPVAALYQFRDASDDTLLEGFMCGEVSSPVPATATRLLLFISEATGPVNCFLADGSVSPGAATTGTVTVDWVPVPPPNPQTKKYSVPTGDAVANCDGIGGACFDRQNAAGTVSVAFDDDRSDAPVGAAYRFTDAAGATITGATGTICGTRTLTVPANAAGIRFFMRTATPPAGCSGRATTGSITVSWS